MPLRPPTRNVSEAESKLRLLFCLDRLGMISRDWLWPFVAQFDMMDYFPFCQYVEELQNSGSIAGGSHALDGVLYVTEKGRQDLQLLGGMLLPTDRERIEAKAPAYREEMRLRHQVRAAYERAEEGRFAASLTLRDLDEPTVYLRISSADRTLVEKAVSGFAHRVPFLVNMLYTMPLQSENEASFETLPQEEALRAADAGKPVLCAFGKSRAAVICVQDDRTRYVLLLLWPDEASAAAWLRTAMAQGTALVKRLTEVLTASDEEAAP